MQLQYLLEPSDFGDEVEAEQFFRHVEVLVRDVIEAHRGNLADVSAQKKRNLIYGEQTFQWGVFRTLILIFLYDMK